MKDVPRTMLVTRVLTHCQSGVIFRCRAKWKYRVLQFLSEIRERIIVNEPWRPVRVRVLVRRVL